jgi:uncharacterized GH25 family protein
MLAQIYRSLPKKWRWQFQRTVYSSILLLVFATNTANCHDIWIEASSGIVRRGEPFRIVCKSGNNFAGRPDFKTSGTIPLAELQTIAYLPTDKQKDLRPLLSNTASDESTGSWQATLDVEQTGIVWLLQRSEQIMEQGKRIRARLMAKTPVIISDSLDHVDISSPPVAFSQPFEIVLNSDLIPNLESEEPIEVRIIKNGVPLADVQVNFSPLGTASQRPDDPQQQFKTDESGIASYQPTNAGLHIISCHYLDESEKSEKFAATYYSTTMCLDVREYSLRQP